MQRNPTSGVFYSVSIMLAAMAIGFAVFSHLQRDTVPPQPPVFALPVLSVGEVD